MAKPGQVAHFLTTAPVFSTLALCLWGEEDKVLVKGKGDEFKGTSKSTLPRVPMVCSCSMVESMCTYVSVYMYRFIRVWDAHKTKVSTFLALETTWKSALGLGPGEFSGPEKGQQIPTLFLCSTLGDYSFPLTNPKDLEFSRKSLSNTTSPSWHEILTGSDLQCCSSRNS